MKNPLVIRVAFLCIGVVIGLLLGSGGRLVDSDGEGNTAEHGSKKQSPGFLMNGRNTSADFSLGRRIKSSNSEEMADLLYLALEEPDAFLRQGHVALALLQMNESNWKEMYENFGEITRVTGMRHHHAWRAALERSGQVGGQDAVELHLHGKTSPIYDQAWGALYGWSQMKPDEAMAWLQSSGDEDAVLRAKLISAVVAGHALTNPETAPAVLETLSSQERLGCVGHFTWNMVQGGGIDKAIDWMLDVNSRYADEDPQFAERVTGEVMGTMAATTTGRGSTDLLVNRIKKIYQNGEVDPNRTRGVITQLGGTQPLDLMLGISDASFFNDLNADGLFAQEVISLVRSRSPEQFEQWVASHPDAEFLSSVSQ